MNFRHIIFGIIAISFILSNFVYFLNAMELENIKENAKKLTVQGAKTTSKYANALAQYLEGAPTPQQIEQAQEIITSPEAQKTISEFNFYGELFEEFTQDHPHFYLAAQGFVGVVLIGTALYLVYKSGTLHKADTVLEFIKKNPEICAMTFLTLLNVSLYVASNLNSESTVNSWYSSVGGWQGMFGITIALGAGIKFYNWLTSGKENPTDNYLALPAQENLENQFQEQPEKQEEKTIKNSATTADNSEKEIQVNTKKQPIEQNSLSSSSSSISSTSSSENSSTQSSCTSSSSTNLQTLKKQLVTDLGNVINKKLDTLPDNNLLSQINDFVLTSKVKKLFEDLQNTREPHKAKGNANSTLNGIKFYLKIQ